MLIIPAIDLKNGACVRLRQGRMDDVTVFSADPVAMAGRWVDAGCRRLHLVDLDGALQGKPVNGDLVKAITKANPNLPIQIGGGIRCSETIETYLQAGVDYVIIGTRAVHDTKFITQMCEDFAGHIIVSLDASEGLVAVDGWAHITDVRAVELAQRYRYDGVSAIVYTDIARDGMMEGVNVEATQQLAREAGIPVIASGGVTSMDDVRELCKLVGDGVLGAITGRAIYEGTLDLAEAQQYCDEQS